MASPVHPVVRGAGSASAGRVIAVLLVVGLLCASGSAYAHQADPNVFTVIDAISPGLPSGVSVTLASSVAELVVLTNTTSRTYEVLGAGGRPFLRVGPRGVRGDFGSPDWYRNNDPSGAARLPADVTASSTPRWRSVSRRPSWSWFDRRVQAAPFDAREIGSRNSLPLGTFTLPLRSRSATTVVRGHSEWRRTLGAIVAALDGEPPAWTGVRLTVLPGEAPGLFLEATGTKPVTVRGDQGEPFARIDADGVTVNRRSPTYVYGLSAAGEQPKLGADATATPVWKRVADVPRYGWLDPRLSDGSDPLRARPERSTPLSAWTIPIEVGGRRTVVRGTTSWQLARGGAAISAPPPAATGDSGLGSTVWAIGLAGGLVAGLCLALVLIGRRR